MVCWDGGRAAARAIGDAMPRLRRAGSVEVVLVINGHGKQDQIEGADIGAHLARHGLNIEVKRIPLGDIDVGDVLLSHAADAEIDFIVMGGYGHSRWWRHPQHVAHNDRAGIDVALSGIANQCSSIRSPTLRCTHIYLRKSLAVIAGYHDV